MAFCHEKLLATLSPITALRQLAKFGQIFQQNNCYSASLVTAQLFLISFATATAIRSRKRNLMFANNW